MKVLNKDTGEQFSYFGKYSDIEDYNSVEYVVLTNVNKEMIKVCSSEFSDKFSFIKN